MPDGWPRLRQSDRFFGFGYEVVQSIYGPLKTRKRGLYSKEAHLRNVYKKMRTDGRYWLSTDIYLEKVLSVARESTFRMIKKLAESERSPVAKAFLSGILKGKSFYAYYVRAGDPDLFKLVGNIRQELMQNSGLLRQRESAQTS